MKLFQIRRIRLLSFVFGAVLANSAESQKWSLDFQLGTFSTFNYFTEKYGQSSLFHTVPNAALGATLGVGYRVAPGYVVAVNYSLFPSMLKYRYSIDIVRGVRPVGFGYARGIGMRELALVVERQKQILPHKKWYLQWLIRGGVSYNFLPPVNRGDYEQPNTQIGLPGTPDQADSTSTIIERPHVIGLKLGTGISFKPKTASRFAYGLIFDSFISPSRFASERVFFSNAGRAMENRIATNGSYVSFRLTVSYQMGKSRNNTTTR
jgi:hypothetical protein